MLHGGTGDWPTSIPHAAQEDSGKCGSECKTLQRAVEDILGDHDTDIAEKLWQARTPSGLTPVVHISTSMPRAFGWRQRRQYPHAGTGADALLRE